MHKLLAAAGAAAALLTTATPAAFASPQPLLLQSDQAGSLQRVEYRRRHRYVRQRSYACERERRSSGNQGTVLGAVAGGLGGNLLAGHGNRGLGTVLGAGVGAVAGHQIAKNRVRC